MTTQADTKTIEVPTGPLSIEEANRIADIFAATPSAWANRDRTTGELVEPAGYQIKPGGVYPLANDAGRDIPREDGRRGTTYEVGPPSYLRYPVLAEAVKDLPNGWDQQVHSLLCARVQEEGRKAQAERDAARKAGYETVENPAIRAYLLAHADERGMKVVEAADLTWMVKAATRVISTNTPYRPEPGCTSKLHLKQAIAFSYEQAAYADYTKYAVPVTIAADADIAVCQRNLRAFAMGLKTHNGLAGSGSTWDLDLVRLPEGDLVIITGRHSISD